MATYSCTLVDCLAYNLGCTHSPTHTLQVAGLDLNAMSKALWWALSASIADISDTLVIPQDAELSRLFVVVESVSNIVQEQIVI